MVLNAGVTNLSRFANTFLILAVKFQCPGQIRRLGTVQNATELLTDLQNAELRWVYLLQICVSHQPGGTSFAESQQKVFYFKNEYISWIVGKFFVSFFKHLSE